MSAQEPILKIYLCFSYEIISGQIIVVEYLNFQFGLKGNSAIQLVHPEFYGLNFWCLLLVLNLRVSEVIRENAA